MSRSKGAARAAVLLLASLLMAGSLAVVPSPATADEWPYVLPPPDRGNHSYCFHPDHLPNGPVGDRMRWSGNTLENQTQVDVVRHSSCGPHTDVRWQQRPIGDPGDHIYGQARCIIVRDNGRCDRFQLRVYWGEIRRDAENPRYQARKTSCHELGHSVGLAHYGNGDPYVGPPRSAAGSPQLHAVRNPG